MQIRTRVRDVMHKKDLPIVTERMPLSEVIVKMTAGRAGLAIVLDDAGNLCGVITDGDLRRSFQKCAQPMDLLAREVMTRDPAVISEDASIREAEDLMRQKRIKALLAVSPDGKVGGVIDVFVNR
jgi:arabinose-5-phosphate isomerase